MLNVIFVPQFLFFSPYTNILIVNIFLDDAKDPPLPVQGGGCHLLSPMGIDKL